MNKPRMSLGSKTLRIALLAAGAAAFACSNKPQECPPVPPNAKTQITELGKVGVTVFVDKDADRCVACVMSPKRFATCQTVYAEKKGESRDSIRARAKEKACEDAGYAKGQCPASAIISQVCKGEPRPQGTTDPGQAVQQMFKGKHIQKVLTAPYTLKPDAPPPVPAPGATPAEAKTNPPGTEKGTVR